MKIIVGNVEKGILVQKNENKPDFGSIMLVSISFVLSGSFLSEQKRVGFITGRMDDLSNFVAHFNLAVGDDYSTKVSKSKLIVEEAVTPWYDGQSAKINPTTKEELLTADGENIYRQVRLVPDLPEYVDRLIQHVTVEVPVETEADPF